MKSKKRLSYEISEEEGKVFFDFKGTTADFIAMVSSVIYLFAKQTDKPLDDVIKTIMAFTKKVSTNIEFEEVTNENH